jgi:DNA-binding protein Fis
MSARDDLINYAATTRTITADGLASYIDHVEREAAAKALSDAVETARGEYLADATGDETDEAYNQGVADVIAAIDQLKA